jgi:hypothetical protein
VTSSQAPAQFVNGRYNESYLSPTNCSNGVGGSLNNLLTSYKSPAIINANQVSTRNSIRNLNKS